MTRNILLNLYYNKKQSMMEIAKRLKISHAKVYYWFKKYKIKRRSWSESSYVKQNPNGDPFKIKNMLNEKEKALLISGLMLYCGEGSRRSKHVIQIANLDSRILRLFVEFLKRICRVNMNKIGLQVQLFKEFDRKTARDYWHNRLLIPKSQIDIYKHTDMRSKIGEQRSKFGIARVQVNNYKLKNWIDKELDEHLDRFNKLKRPQG
jgi:hypothetical protein